jgi:hypothetical protein
VYVCTWTFYSVIICIYISVLSEMSSLYTYYSITVTEKASKLTLHSAQYIPWLSHWTLQNLQVKTIKFSIW